jgi:hypothetical protein
MLRAAVGRVSLSDSRRFFVFLFYDLLEDLVSGSSLDLCFFLIYNEA